jgi:putative ABC transport system permease protein
MQYLDVFGFAWRALERYRLRTGLLLLAMAIGVASIIILTALGDGARRYVTGEFASLGTNLIIVLPGRSETTGGGSPAMFIGGTPRDLTIEDAMALTRSSTVRRIAPINVGSAPVSWGGLERDAPIIGSTSDLLDIRHWELTQGKFLPEIDPRQSLSVCVIGGKVKDELFGVTPALGEWLRIGEHRFRVIGVLGSEGRSIGVDVQDLVVVPLASAQDMFNTPSLFRILVEASSRESISNAKRFVREAITARHQGEEDITVITQDAVLATFDRILLALTFTVAGIAAISLAVAGILIMNVMLISVVQRTTEIGLLKAIGATHRQIMQMFLMEALQLSTIGAVTGVIIGELGSWIIRQFYPSIPMYAPLWAVLASMLVAMGTGLLFGTMPAGRAAKLDPVMALQKR